MMGAGVVLWSKTKRRSDPWREGEMCAVYPSLAAAARRRSLARLASWRKMRDGRAGSWSRRRARPPNVACLATLRERKEYEAAAATAAALGRLVAAIFNVLSRCRRRLRALLFGRGRRGRGGSLVLPLLLLFLGGGTGGAGGTGGFLLRAFGESLTIARAGLASGAVGWLVVPRFGRAARAV